MTDTINDVAVEAAAQEEPVEPAIDEQSVAEQLVAPGPGEGASSWSARMGCIRSQSVGHYPL